MSDDSGFDKEAEREKLREKYGDDDADRENTRRMSELLLKGATMTGKHCDNCGDPIFRHDGQEFCPTCQHEAQQARSANADPNQSGERTDESPQTAGAADPANGTKSTDAADPTNAVDAAGAGADRGATDQQSDDEPRIEINDVRVADQHADRSNVRRPPSQVGDADESRRHGPDRTSGAHDHTHRHAQGASARDAGARRASARPQSDDAGDLAPARDALVRTLSDLAHRAEETDDVARARELLGATREAAEALAALDRANR
ncbi:Sjogren's syndrome/scleroderma autoantigen 1 family protein [Halorussus pelagicus]|uniref:Sjogren's syndrome/scleroderma autoantigen 1 family protein n=1 Tax=Halorussus pelagicus TaxID=2505977 RepID=UPI000FFBE349|nr:Sjogren's syndrome/scleroderma autoantigen 1 family protein [Halorussus pelagicus]